MAEEESRSLDQEEIETIHRMASESSEFFYGLAQALERLRALFRQKAAVPAS